MNSGNPRTGNPEPRPSSVREGAETTWCNTNLLRNTWLAPGYLIVDDIVRHCQGWQINREQQIPSGANGAILRSVFRARKGYKLMSVDFTGLEVWVAAYFMEDEVLQRVLQEGQNFHDENTKIFFGIDKTDPHWHELRGVAKTIAFARLERMACLNRMNSGNAEMPILSQAS